ncbi:MAG: hypothetical protein KGI37_07205 [Alphaproteobacteria bacterium]|nr:hypothetical protein [Alphaproteobacteria bacterium]
MSQITMPSAWLYLFAGAVMLSAAGFVCVAVMWLRKLRETVGFALADAASQQIHANQRANDAIAQIQKQQDHYAHQIQVLAEAGIRLQQEISSVAHRVDTAQETDPRSGNHTVH